MLAKQWKLSLQWKNSITVKFYDMRNISICCLEYVRLTFKECLNVKTKILQECSLFLHNIQIKVEHSYDIT